MGCSRWGLNKSDQYQFSPNNTHTSLREKVRRIHKTISEGKMLWSIKVGAKQEWPTSITHTSSKEKVRRILAHFPRFCWQYFSLSNVFSIHLARKTYFLLCSGLWNIFLNLLMLFCYKIKSRRRLLKTMAIFSNFVKTALIWLVLGGFLCVFSQSETICNLHLCYKFCTRVTSLHSCYRRTALFSQPIRIE